MRVSWRMVMVSLPVRGEGDRAVACGGFRDGDSGEHVGEDLCCLVVCVGVHGVGVGVHGVSSCFFLWWGCALIVVYHAQTVRVYTCGRFGVGVSCHVGGKYRLVRVG